MAGEMKMPFGKFGPGRGDYRAVREVPSDYLTWILEQEYMADRYGEDLIEEIELVMAERDREDKHWHEYEEPY